MGINFFIVYICIYFGKYFVEDVYQVNVKTCLVDIYIYWKGIKQMFVLQIKDEIIKQQLFLEWIIKRSSGQEVYEGLERITCSLFF